MEVRIEILRLADVRNNAESVLGDMSDICPICMINLNRKSLVESCRFFDLGDW